MRTESHRRVTLGVLFVTVAWLLPFAYLVATDRIDGTIGAILAYLPLIAIAIVSGAGKPETNPAN
jgi:Fuc2NAc and GlcNAc transferase